MSHPQKFLSLDHKNLTTLPSEYLQNPNSLSDYEIIWLNHNNLTLESFPSLLDILSNCRRLKWLSCIQGGSFWPGFDENPLNYHSYRLYILHHWYKKSNFTLSTLDSKQVSKEEWKNIEKHILKEDFSTDLCPLCQQVVWVRSLHSRLCSHQLRMCSMHRFGCRVKGLPKEIEEHQEKDCPYYKLRHVLLKQESKIAHLEEELILLTYKHHPIKLMRPKCLVMAPGGSQATGSQESIGNTGRARGSSSTTPEGTPMSPISSKTAATKKQNRSSLGSKQNVSMAQLHRLYSPSGGGNSENFVYRELVCLETESQDEGGLDSYGAGSIGSVSPTSAPTPSSFSFAGDFPSSTNNNASDARSPTSYKKTSSIETPSQKFYKDLISYTPILTQKQIDRLHPKFPTRYQNCDFVLRFTAQLHGRSLQHAIQKCHGIEPILIVIRTMDNEIFGAYCSSEWRDAWRQYYGTGESFLFTFEPDLFVYKWSKANTYFQYSNTKFIALGGSGTAGVPGSQGKEQFARNSKGGKGKGFGLKINDGLATGSTSCSDTFNNDPLTPKRDFEILNIEFWNFRERK